MISSRKDRERLISQCLVSVHCDPKGRGQEDRSASTAQSSPDLRQALGAGVRSDFGISSEEELPPTVRNQSPGSPAVFSQAGLPTCVSVLPDF